MSDVPRMESDIIASSVKFASSYMRDRFRGGSKVEESLVINSIAHGYYMGAKHRYSSRRSIWSWFRKTEVTSDYIDKHAQKASNFYLKKFGYTKLEWSNQALIRACVAIGFRHAYEERREAA